MESLIKKSKRVENYNENAVFTVENLKITFKKYLKRLEITAVGIVVSATYLKRECVLILQNKNA